jgi:hypothetical protein
MEVKKMNLLIPAKVPCRQHRLGDRSVKKYPEDATDLSMSGGSQEKLQGWQQMTEERCIGDIVGDLSGRLGSETQEQPELHQEAWHDIS